MFPKMGEMGLLGVTVPENLGGLGLGYMEHTIAMEGMSGGAAKMLKSVKEELMSRINESFSIGCAELRCASRRPFTHCSFSQAHSNLMVNQLRRWGSKSGNCRHRMAGKHADVASQRAIGQIPSSAPIGRTYRLTRHVRAECRI